MGAGQDLIRRRRAAGRRLGLAVTAGALLVAASCGGGADDPAAAPPTGSATGAAGAPATAATPTTDGAADVGTAFLVAWQKGELDAAADLTDAPDAARGELQALAQQLPIRQTVIVPEPGTRGDGQTLGFAVTLDLGDAGPWSYRSSLVVLAAAIPGAGSGAWHVHWSPSIVHPKLVDGATLQLGHVAGAASVLGNDGRPLAPTTFPSLAPILPKLAAVTPEGAGPTTTVVQVVPPPPGGPPEVLDTLAAPGPPPVGGLTTTIDPQVQAAAERSVATAPALAGLVVLRASTGAILAMANNPPGGQNITTSMQAPGSTMKVVVAAALLRSGVGPSTVVPCPATTTVGGQTFRNSESHETGGSSPTLSLDFAASCNTAFIDAATAHLGATALGQEAAAFGITASWDIGLHEPRTYGSVPDPGGDKALFAEAVIGQGRVTSSPLAMASVAATASTGAFHQPVLVPTAPRASAGGLSGSTVSALRQMMRAAVTSGTATSLRDVPGDVGAKTGTAETGSGTNAWMIAYRGDLAVAVEVVGGGAGDAAAGPVVRALLTSLG